MSNIPFARSLSISLATINAKRNEAVNAVPTIVGGYPPYRVRRIGPWKAGLQMEKTTGAVTGAAAHLGTAVPTLIVTDAAGQTASVDVTITITEADAVTFPTLGPATANLGGNDAAYTPVATVSGLQSGEVILRISPNDGRMIRADGGTKLVRGYSATTAEVIDLTLYTNLLRSFVMKVTATATASAGGNVTAILLAVPQGLYVGQTINATVSPVGAAIKWMRITKGGSPVTTEISRGAGTSYTVTSDDLGCYIEARSLDDVVIARTIGWVLKAFATIDSLDTVTGIGPTSATLNIVTDASRKTEGISAVRIERKLGQAFGDLILKRTGVKTLVPADIDVLVVDYIHDDNGSNNSVTVGIEEPGGLVIAATNGSLPTANNMARQRIPLVLDASTISGKSASAVAVNTYLRSAARDPYMGKATFDWLRTGKGIPTVVMYGDDAYRSFYTLLGQYAKDRNIGLTGVIPTDSLRNTVDGSGFYAKTDIAPFLAQGHALVPNITTNDVGVSAYATLDALVANLKSGQQILRDAGVPERMLVHGVYSNGEYATSGGNSVTATYSGTGGVTLSGAPSSVTVAVGTSFRGYDQTTKEVIDTTVTAVSSQTSFTTAYAFPDNSASGNKGARVWNPNLPFFGRNVPDRLAAEGLRTARSTVVADVRMPTRFGVPDPLIMPSQSFTNLGATEIIAGTSTLAKQTGTTVAWYTHDVVPGNGANGTSGVGHYETQLKLVLDSYATDIQAGNLQVLTIDQLWARDGAAGMQA